jgi:hypothetical protein
LRAFDRRRRVEPGAKLRAIQRAAAQLAHLAVGVKVDGLHIAADRHAGAKIRRCDRARIDLLEPAQVERRASDGCKSID